ncbi:helix-turn-helix domain-containing protein [Rhodococcus sp. APC 3903]|uniref:PucR family transcriptional regulator n=1 Tax=Rhodococcus sp. APC 3903 TaxID=3035193 RepID=UPI0025B4B81D|nr:helix-turn-helix domain-containing protein [Rhodococcus sp. APC 3903]MDN3460675.1 helix-turn-helix domain-containing protein [Rhodococcus sp. APC 3903]
MDRRALPTEAVSEILRKFLFDPDKLASIFHAKLMEEFPDSYEVSPEIWMPVLADAIIRINSVVSTGREFNESDYSSFESYGAARAQLGIPLDVMLRGWQIGVGKTVDGIVEFGRTKMVDGNILVDITRFILGATEVAIRYFVIGYKASRLIANGGMKSTLSTFLKNALINSPDSDEIKLEAIEYGFRLDREYHTFSVTTFTEMSLREIERSLMDLPGFTAPDGAVALIEGSIAGFCTTDVIEYPGVTIGIGPLASIGALGNSMRSASRAATTARMFKMTGCYSLLDLGLLPAVSTDLQVGDLLYERFVLPLGRGEVARAILKTVDEYLETGQNVEATATKLHVHQNTVRYRIARYEKIIGGSLKNSNLSRNIWWALRRLELVEDSRSDE